MDKKTFCEGFYFVLTLWLCKHTRESTLHVYEAVGKNKCFMNNFPKEIKKVKCFLASEETFTVPYGNVSFAQIS